MDLQRLETISRVMDDWIEIPGLRYRIGLDGVIGLIPGIGDVAGFFVSSLLLAEAARAGLSRWVLFRMVLNILFDALIGAIPFVGDVADFFWKANRSNLQLLRKSLAEPRATRQQSAFFVLMVVGLTGLLAAGLVWSVWQLLSWLLHTLQTF